MIQEDDAMLLTCKMGVGLLSHNRIACHFLLSLFPEGLRLWVAVIN